MNHYVQGKFPRPNPINMEKRAFAITRGYMVYARASGWYIVGPRDKLDKNAARKGQERNFTTEAGAWLVAWSRAQQAGRKR